ncbi:MAG: hypothetical protein NC300_03235 [Bacteroidales bacterium]|nr:hypothetical protein [Clostridium sp.]MCM1203132.1 hypothetical protein [Bacteroidales bacterium]
MKKFIIMIAVLFLLLIFHNETIAGTKSGLLLWYQTLIPSLLPFILVTNALAETNAYQSAANTFRKYFPNSRIYEWIAIFLGNLCGYPIGGKIINDFVKNQYLTPGQADRLLALSSQASPMFLVGYVHLHIIGGKISLPVFLLGIYLPVILAYPFLTAKNEPNHTSVIQNEGAGFCLVDTFLHATQIMVMIGIYVIIFSIILVILLPFCHSGLLRTGLSFLEITTGLKLLASLTLSEPLKLSLLAMLSAFGGLCSAFQILGVLDYPGANIKKYLLDKICLSTGTFFIILFYLHFLS